MSAGERTSPSAQAFAKLLGDGPMARVALRALLAEIESPAFIVSAKGTVLHANSAGERRALRSADQMRAVLARAIARRGNMDEPKAPLVTPLRCEKGPEYYLVIFRAPSSVSENVDYVATLWGLTPRQKDVLVLLAEGFSNTTIAVRLSCAERTVETHLTAIFEKSGFDGRSALLASIAKRTT